MQSVILTGAGDKAFCTGGDVKQRAETGDYGPSRSGMFEIGNLHKLIRDIPKPVIAAVNGVAVGGGHVLHVLCDVSLASETARFGQAGPKVGSFDAGFGTAYLARVVGEKKAREMWFWCRVYNADEALAMGLVNKVVPAAELMAEARGWAAEVAQKSPTAIRFLKQSFNADTDHQAGTSNRPQMVADMATMGFTGLRIPETYGGQGASAVVAGVAAEEVARADFNASYMIIVTALICDVLVRNVTDRLRGKWLPPIAIGDAIPALCVTEPEHGTDAARLTMRAERGRASLHFDGLRVGDDRLIGNEGEGFVSVMQGFVYSRAIIGLACLGAAQVSLDETLQWVRDRHAFGQNIGKFQGVAFPLAEHATYIRGARHVCYEALWKKDHDLDHSSEAAMAKFWAPKLSADVIHQCLLTFGHMGYSNDNPLGQRLRDVMGLEIGDGTAQASKLVIARNLLGRAYAP